MDAFLSKSVFAIFSDTIENADWLSRSLERIWGMNGRSISVHIYENEEQFLESMQQYSYGRVILDNTDTPRELVEKIRVLNPNCKIGVITKSRDSTKQNQIAVECHDVGVDTMLTRTAMEEPLMRLSQRLSML